MNRLTIVLLLLAVGLGLLVVNHNGGRTLGIDNDQFAQVLYLLPIAGLPKAVAVEGVVTASTIAEAVFNGIGQVSFQGSIVTGIFFAIGLVIVRESHAEWRSPVL